MKTYVIVGNSAAGIAAIEAIRKKDKESKIVVLSDENYPAYCRCLISYYLARDIKEDKISYRPESFYMQNNAELLLNKKVTRVDPQKNKVICDDKGQFKYDALLIATGSHSKFPDIKGIKKKGVFGFRTIKDAKDIEGMIPLTKTACVLGGGLIGLKAAYALKKRNIGVKVIIKSKQVLSQMLDSEAAGMIQKRLEENGIEIVLGQDATEVIGNGDIKAIKLDSGKVLECSLLIVGKGVEPNTDLVKDTEVKVGAGILANTTMQSNVSNIFTAGDVCETFDAVLGGTSINALWPVAVEEGKIAGQNLAGAHIDYEGSISMNSIEFFGLPVISLGMHKIKENSRDYEELRVFDAKASVYKKIILKDKIIVGVICAGDIKNSGVFLSLIRKKIEVTPFKDKLLQDNFGYPDIMDFMKDRESIYLDKEMIL